MNGERVHETATIGRDREDWEGRAFEKHPMFFYMLVCHKT